jgi:hypothetical protein
MSAFLHAVFKSFVLLLQDVIVAHIFINMALNGNHTVLQRPTIVIFFHFISSHSILSIFIHACGVAGIILLISFQSIFHKLFGCNQSTSFSGSINQIISS